jgi:Na+-transporting NADH:ubiquinone oxidoreductase subunit F
MSHDTAVLTKPPTHLDYSLTGENATRAIERGLAEVEWYQCPVPRATLRKLLERRDGPAIRDTMILFGLLVITGWATAVLWGSWWRSCLTSFMRHFTAPALIRADTSAATARHSRPIG